MKQPLVNTLSLLVGDVGSRVVGFLITVYLARVVEPGGFGLIALGLSLLGYLSLLGSPGIQTLETRNVAASGSTNVRRIGAVLSLRVILSLLLVVSTSFVMLLVVGDDKTLVVLLLFSLSLIPLSMNLDWLLQGKELFPAVGLARLALQLVYGFVIFIFVSSADDLAVIPVAFFVANAIAAFLLWTASRKRIGDTPFLFDVKIWKDIARSGIPTGLAMMLAQGATSLPPLLLGIVSSMVHVGYYAAAMKLIALFLLLDRLLNGLFLPVVTRYCSSRKGELDALVGTTLRVVLVVGLPLGIALAIASPILMLHVFGPEYLAGVPVLQLLTGYLVITLVNSVFVNVLLGAGLEKRYVRMITIGSSILAVSVVFFTALVGVIGAAMGVVVGELAILVLLLTASRNLVRISLPDVIGRPLGAAAMAGVVVYFGWELDPTVLVPLSCVTFLLAVPVTRSIRREDIDFVRRRFV